MTRANERLAMFHSHLKENNIDILQPEFPLLSNTERQFYLQNNFQSTSCSKNTPKFAPSNISVVNAPVVLSREENIKNQAYNEDSVSHYTTNSDLYRSQADRVNEDHKKGSLELFFDATRKIEILLHNQRLANEGETLALDESGTSGWDFFGTNIVNFLEDHILCISGNDSQGMADCLTKYVGNNNQIDILEINQEDSLSLNLIRNSLLSKNYSTCVLSHTNIAETKEICLLLKEASPDSLVAVNVFQSIGNEEIQIADFEVDFIFTNYEVPSSTSEHSLIIYASERALLKGLEIDTRKVSSKAIDGPGKEGELLGKSSDRNTETETDTNEQCTSAIESILSMRNTEVYKGIAAVYHSTDTKTSAIVESLTKYYDVSMAQETKGNITSKYSIIDNGSILEG